jgi:hypothetical protein
MALAVADPSGTFCRCCEQPLVQRIGTRPDRLAQPIALRSA